MGANSSRFAHYGESPDGTGDLNSLSHQYRIGFIIIGTLALLSFLSCGILFLFITLRLIQWRMIGGKPRRTDASSSGRGDMSLDFGDVPSSDPEVLNRYRKGAGSTVIDRTGAESRAERAADASDVSFFGNNNSQHIDAITTSPPPPMGGGLPLTKNNLGAATTPATQQSNVPNIRKSGRKGLINPLLILIYMLLVADVLQSASLLLNLVWVVKDGITVRSDTCWAQGWLRSHGDLSSSLLAAAISVYTYFNIVKGRWGSYRTVIATAVAVWIFSTFIVAAGVWASKDGSGHGGYWARVQTWCWISEPFKAYRLWSHFAWVLASMAVVLCMCIAIAVHLTVDRGTHRGGGFALRFRSPRESGHHPVFLIYPVLFLICSLPMALGPLILLGGVTIKIEYFMWAGAMIASNGWMDVVLWSSTMILLAPKDISDAGLDQFIFVRTPRERQYGNMVWVQGGKENKKNRASKGPGQWWRLRADSEPKQSAFRESRGEAEDSMRSHGHGHGQNDQHIQMETVTTVMVEDSKMGDTPKGSSRQSHEAPSMLSSY